MVVRLEAETSKYQTQLAAATKQLQNFQSDVGDSVKEIAASLVELLAVDKLVEFTNQVIESTAHLSDFAAQTGIATDQLSKLNYSAKLEGVTDLDTALAHLSKSAGGAAEGNKDLQGAFTALGVSATDAQGRIKPTDQLLLSVADGFSKYADGAAKSAIAQQLFGRGGADLIGFLDQGSAAIRAQGDELAQLGGVVTPAAARAAKEYEDNLTRLNTAGTALVQQSLGVILPHLIDITDAMVSSAKDANGLSDGVAQLESGFKLLATGGVVVVSVFETIGKTLAAQAATVSAFASSVHITMADVAAGPLALAAKVGTQLASALKPAGATIGAAYEDISDTLKKNLSTLSGVWDGTDDQLKEIAVTAQKIKPQLTLIDTKAQDSAIETLKKFKEGLDQQIAGFGQGAAAATSYDVMFGRLATDVAAAGAQGLKLRDAIIADANALELLKDRQALKGIDAQMLALTGHTVEAADAQFDLANAQLKASLAAMHNDAGNAGLQQLANQRAMNEALAQSALLQKQVSDIEGAAALQQSAIDAKIANGIETTLDGQKQIADSRTAEISQLGDVYTKLQALGTSSGIVSVGEQAKQLQIKLNELVKDGIDPLATKLKTDFTDDASTAFASFVTGTQTASQAFHQFLSDFESELIKLAAKNLLEGLLGGSDKSGGAFGLLASFLGGAGGASTSVAGGDALVSSGLGSLDLTAGVFGGGLASGGPVTAGTSYTVGEHGAEAFVPNVNGSIIPNNKMQTSQPINNYFTIAAPAGTVSRQTQQQIAAAASLGAQRAHRRSN